MFLIDSYWRLGKLWHKMGSLFDLMLVKGHKSDTGTVSDTIPVYLLQLPARVALAGDIRPLKDDKVILPLKSPVNLDL